MFVSLNCISCHARNDTTIDLLMRALDEAYRALPIICSQLLAKTLLARDEDAQLVWRICFETEQAYRDCLLEPVWRQQVKPLLARDDLRVESVAYRRGLHGVACPEIADGVWRALVVSVIAGTDRVRRDQFEREMANMPAYIGSIRNWAMSPVIESSGARNWSYIWEQDFDDVGGLLGEYRMHPMHWGLIDRWYDIEHPEHIIDGRMLRTVCPSPGSAIQPK